MKLKTNQKKKVKKNKKERKKDCVKYYAVCKILFCHPVNEEIEVLDVEFHWILTKQTLVQFMFTQQLSMSLLSQQMIDYDSLGHSVATGKAYLLFQWNFLWS